MKNLSEITAKEIKEILTQKEIAFQYVIGDYNMIWVGYGSEAYYNWIGFSNENSFVIAAEMYSKTMGKTLKGSSTRMRVYNRFQKLINK